MDTLTDRWSATAGAEQTDLVREFETRLVDSSTLAFRVAYSVLRQREDAEDVAQEAYVKAFRRFRQLRDRDRFRAWLVRVTWRLALDRRRADRRRSVRESGQDDVEPFCPGSSPAERLRARELWRAIDRLPNKLRVAVVLANIEGYGIDEVAMLLGVPAGTVKSRLFHARRRLKELLQ